MSVGKSFQKIAEIITSLEQHEITVTSATTQETELSPDTAHTVELSATERLLDEDYLSDDTSVSIDEATINENGMLHLDLTAETKITDTGPRRAGNTTSGPPDRTVTERSGDQALIPTQDTEQPRDENPDVLREVYETCDSFREMRDALGVDVTPETIRRRMISHGIHTVPPEGDEPMTASSDLTSEEVMDEEATDDTDDEMSDLSNSTDEESRRDWDDQELALPDGGIVSDLTIEELAETVESSDTLYDACKKLEMDQDRTRQLLRELGLIDLVTGRLATLEDRTVTREEIERRIRSTTVQSGGS